MILPIAYRKRKCPNNLIHYTSFEDFVVLQNKWQYQLYCKHLMFKLRSTLFSLKMSLSTNESSVYINFRLTGACPVISIKIITAAT